MTRPIFSDKNTGKAKATGDDEILNLLGNRELDGPTIAYLAAGCSTREAAELLGISPGSLKNLRAKGEGPPGFVVIPGIGGRYKSKLEILRWYRRQYHQALLEPSARKAAA